VASVVRREAPGIISVEKQLTISYDESTRVREEADMADVPRTGVEEARRKAAAGEALLVCAYPDEMKCNKMRLQGSMTLPELEARVPSLPRDQEIIFYCA
jgi:hypothetical protein